MSAPYKQWLCLICGFIYDEAKGWPRDGLAPGTRWEDVPDDWLCPDCLVGKADFDMVELPVAQATTAPTAVSLTPQPSTAIPLSTHIPTGPIVIVGSGYAGYNLAETIRNHHASIEIVVLSEDDGMHYSKPALSTGLTHQQSADDLVTEKPLDRANRLNMRIVTHCQVQAIDKIAKVITTNLGHQPYGQLVLATGAAPIVLPVAGDASSQVLSINNLLDYRIFRQTLSGHKKVLLIGNGLIGCEFANDLAANGFHVDVVGLSQWPMARQLPKVLGQKLKTQLQSIGVNWYLQNTVQSIDYVNANQPSLGYQVTLHHGQQLHCDVIVSAVGLQAKTQLALDAGLAVDQGVQVDAYLTTCDSAIFALGDCSEVLLNGATKGQLMPYIAPIYWGIQALAKTLTGTPTAVSYPLMTVLVKTPICPLTLLPPPQGIPGEWQIMQQDDDGAVAKFVTPAGTMVGFALQGNAIEQRADFIKAMSD